MLKLSVLFFLWDFIRSQLSQVSLKEKETNIRTAGQTFIDKTGKAISCIPSVGIWDWQALVLPVSTLAWRGRARTTERGFGDADACFLRNCVGCSGKVGEAGGKGLQGWPLREQGRAPCWIQSVPAGSSGPPVGHS